VSSDELTQRLADITANLEAYIKKRAEDIAAAQVAVAEKEFAGHLSDLGKELADLREGHAQAYQRWTDLEKELRRQLDAQLKRVDHMGDALLDVITLAERHAAPLSEGLRPEADPFYAIADLARVWAPRRRSSASAAATR
jgi:uncharacterized protein YhaN